MRNKQRKNKGNPIISGVILIIIGLCFSIFGLVEYIGINGELLNLSEATASDLEDGDFVELDVDYAYYSYCENIETTNYVFKRTTHQYYLINSLQDDYYFIGLKIADSKTDDLEALSDYNFYITDTNPGPLHYVGKLKSADSETYGYMQDYIYDMYEYSFGYTLTSDDKELLDSYMIPYYVEVIEPSSCLAYIIIGLILLLIGIICIIASVIKKKNTVVIPDTPVTPYSDDMNTGAYGNEANAYGNTYGTTSYNSDDSLENSVSSAPDSIPYTPGQFKENTEDGDTDYSGLNKDTFL